MKRLALLLFIIATVYSETLFEVRDASNNKVLDVSTDGLRVLSGPDTLMVISTTGIRAFIDDSKVLSRTFSVTTTSAKKGYKKIFEIQTGAGSTFFNPDDNTDEIFSINKGSITANVNQALGRDFLVNDDVISKANSNLMKVSSKSTAETINDSTMLWYKEKNAFRVGHVLINNPDSVGHASFAAGSRNKASGSYSTALGTGTEALTTASFTSGVRTVASGLYATSMGFESIASNLISFAIGDACQASGSRSIAMGAFSRAGGYGSFAAGFAPYASGDNSAALNNGTEAQSYCSLAAGRYNIIQGSKTSWVATDPLFVIGNGTSNSARADAFVVRKDGKVAIGNIVPNSKLDVAGDVRINDNSLYLRGPNDTYHGLKYVSTWNSTSIDGPALFGYAGGALSTYANNTLALRWDSAGSIYIPSLYTTTGNTQKKYLFVDQYGKLCINTTKESEIVYEEMISEQNKEIESLKNENIMIRKELEEIKRILNKN